MLDQLERQVRKVILAATECPDLAAPMAQWVRKDPKGFLDHWALAVRTDLRAYKGQPGQLALTELLVPQARKAIQDQQAPWATRARKVYQARAARQAQPA